MATPYDFSQLPALGTEREALQRQLELARAIRARPAQRFSTWGGQAASSLGDVLSEISGGIREKQLADAIRANQEKEQTALGGFSTALQGASDSPEELDRLALGAIASGHPALAQAGSAAMQSTGQRLTRSLQQQQLEKEKAEASKRGQEEAELNDPASARTRQAYGLAKQFGIDVPAGATAAQILPLLPLGEKAWETRETISARDRAASEAASKRGSEVGEGLRKEFVGNPVVKATQEVAGAFQKIQSAASKPSAAGDMSLIFSYMKMLDPGSTVREGEYANAQNAGSIDQRIVGMYNAAVNGQKLADNVRTDFVGQARNLMGAQLQRYRPLASEYERLAQEAGLNPRSVVLDFGLEPKAPEGKGGGAAPKLRTDASARTAELYRQGLKPDDIISTLRKEGLLSDGG